MLFKYSHFCFSGKKLNARRVSSSHYRVSLLSVIVDDRQNDHQDLQFKAWPKLHWSRLEPREISPKEGWLTSYWCEQHSSLISVSLLLCFCSFIFITSSRKFRMESRYISPTTLIFQNTGGKWNAVNCILTTAWTQTI